jgi:site-specific recombinase XerD
MVHQELRSTKCRFSQRHGSRSRSDNTSDHSPIPHRAELIFCADDGSLLRPGRFQEVRWAAQKRAGLRRIKWHDLRHSYASVLASGGMPLFLIRGLLGHSSIAMTERYTHLAASTVWSCADEPRVSQGLPSPRPSPASGRGRWEGSTLASRN